MTEKYDKLKQDSKLSDQICMLTESIGTRNQFIDEQIKTAELEAKKQEKIWRDKCKQLADEYLGQIKGIKIEVQIMKGHMLRQIENETKLIKEEAEIRLKMMLKNS